MRLQTIKLEEYVLCYEEFSIEKLQKGKSDNKNSFERDFLNGGLNRYKGTYVSYKDGILCGQSSDEELLRRNVYFFLCTPNVDIFRVL